MSMPMCDLERRASGFNALFHRAFDVTTIFLKIVHLLCRVFVINLLPCMPYWRRRSYILISLSACRKKKVVDLKGKMEFSLVA